MKLMDARGHREEPKRNYFDAWKNCGDFSGRATRREFWIFYIINSLILGAVAGFGLPQLSTVLFVGSLLPQFAIGIRRMHDTNHSGWWLLIPLVNLSFAVSEGTWGDNRFGADPRVLIPISDLAKAQGQPPKADPRREEGDQEREGGKP